MAHLLILLTIALQTAKHSACKDPCTHRKTFEHVTDFLCFFMLLGIHSVRQVVMAFVTYSNGSGASEHGRSRNHQPTSCALQIMSAMHGGTATVHARVHKGTHASEDIACNR